MGMSRGRSDANRTGPWCVQVGRGWDMRADWPKRFSGQRREDYRRCDPQSPALPSHGRIFSRPFEGAARSRAWRDIPRIPQTRRSPSSPPHRHRRRRVYALSLSCARRSARWDGHASNIAMRSRHGDRRTDGEKLSHGEGQAVLSNFLRQGGKISRRCDRTC